MTENTENTVNTVAPVDEVHWERWVRPEEGGYVLFKEDGRLLRAFSTCFEFIVYREMTALMAGGLLPPETTFDIYYRERTGEALADTTKLPAFLDRQEAPMRDEVPTQPHKTRNQHFGQRIVDLAQRATRP